VPSSSVEDRCAKSFQWSTLFTNNSGRHTR